MTRREKILATSCLLILFLAGGGVLAHLFVIEPLAQVRGELRAAQEARQKKANELASEENQIANILRVNPRLAQWQKISLPPNDPETAKLFGVSPEEKKRKHIAAMQVEYERYLDGLMRQNGILKDSIVISPRQPDRRSAVPLKGKEPMYERLAFQATGKGSYDNIVRVLRQFYQTPLLHQVRSLTVGLPTTRDSARSGLPAGTLEMNLTVEALLVKGAEERTTLLPSQLTHTLRVLAEPIRSYDQLAKRNMFVGVTPPPLPRDPPPPPPVRVEKKPEPPKIVTEERSVVLRFVRLTMLWYNPDRKRWEASLYDQAKGGSEIQLNTGVRNEFIIRDKDSYKILEAKVRHIDERQMIFQEQTSKKFYRVICGDFLYPAVNEPLRPAELKEFGIEPEPEPKKEEQQEKGKTKRK